MSEDIRALSARALRQAYQSRTLSPVEVTETLLDQIERQDPALNAWCLIDRETTLTSAREAEQRYLRDDSQGLLDGIPVAIKDVFLTPMWPTLKGSRTVDPAKTLGKRAPAVAALERHGYVPLGKTTTPEFGWKGVTDSPMCGATNNPWDPAKTAGGSSGGSAAAVAAGMAPLALGTDAGGSIRIPAAFCGIVGHKPTFGEVPHWPASPFGTLAHAGPMTRTVEDCALMMQVLSEADPRDAQAAPRRPQDYLAALDGGLKGLRIAYSRNLGYVDVAADIEQACDEAVAVLRDLGAEVVEADPGFRSPLAAFGHLFYGGAANACRELGARQRSLMDPALMEVVSKAERLSMLDYLGAVNERLALSERMALFHEKYDLLVTPTLPITAFDTAREVPVDWPSTRWPTWTPFTYPFNLTGQPALSLPLGLDRAGLPMGLQIVGRRFDDALVLRAGHQFEQQRPWRRFPPLAGVD
ncbi:amidase [Alloalcanivorax xenomutans]|uniref:Amidase n=1 Tax=Alloalcanivorax xenomutans TaxID=1094342 RepID=A0A9Q3W5Z4_9GAMM|nr:amidase [Alloalcanivorax xenomutans]ARB46947.1 amidase [Alloalcanivorax xenomutans]MCE7509634.1 amidase [Alloalcanivorax xenomutans]MCE7525208.1 amidase [Alloalcanivorax xenomutans]